MDKRSTAPPDIVDQEFLDSLPDLGDDDDDAAMIDVAAYVSNSSEMSETYDDGNIMTELIDSSDDDEDDWSYLTNFDDDPNAAYIGPRYDYIDDMIARYIFADNDGHQFFVQKIKLTTGITEHFKNKSLLETENKFAREAVQVSSGMEIPAAADTEPIQSILYPGESATRAEQYFMQVAHPFLQQYTDLEKATKQLELVPDCLAFAFYIAFFSQARRPRTKEGQTRDKPQVVLLLESVYRLADERIERMASVSEPIPPSKDYSDLDDVDDDAMAVEALKLKTFYAWCVCSKLALVVLSKETPDIIEARRLLEVANIQATMDGMLSPEEKLTILQCIYNTQTELVKYQTYKRSSNSRLQLKNAMRKIWIHPYADFANYVSVQKRPKLRFV